MGGGFANDEAGGDGKGLGGRAGGGLLDAGEEGTNGVGGDFGLGHAYGGEGGVNKFREMDVVKAHEGHVLGNTEAALLKCAKGADGGHIVGAEDRGGRVRQGKEGGYTMHAAFELVIALENEVFAGGAAGLLHGGEEGLAAKEGGVLLEGAGDETDVAVAEVGEVLDRLQHALAVVDEEDVLGKAGVGDVNEDHGDVAMQKLVEDGVFNAKGHHGDAVDVALNHAAEAVLEFGVVVGGADKKLIAAIDGGSLEALDELGEEGIGDVGDKESEEAAFAGDERAGLGVRKVVEVADGLMDAGGELRVDGRDVVDGAGHSGDRDAGAFCDVADVKAGCGCDGAGWTVWLSGHRSRNSLLSDRTLAWSSFHVYTRREGVILCVRKKTITSVSWDGAMRDLRVSRRRFVKGSAALAAGTAVMRGAPGMGLVGPEREVADPGQVALTQFEYGDVQLLDGPMLEQFRHNHQLFLNLSEDSLLKPFRQSAGMPAPGEEMGGWYSPSSRFDPPKDMTGYIPGHSFGQYLSGLARASAVTGDAATKAKVARLVAGFAPTVTTKFYQGYCLPAYTFDKTNCGLIDAHQFAGDPQAMAVLAKATDAVLPWLPEKALNRDEMAARPHPTVAYTWDEPYTLPENFYLGYQRGAGNRYRALARKYLQDDTYFGPLADGKNVLPGQHAYSHLNALCSAVQSYLTDGSEMHLRAAKNGFRFVLEQSFATGGWGPDEGFRRPGTDELAKSLQSSHNSFETPCGAYGHFKVTRYLQRVTGESWYGDSMEAVLYNTILGARPIRPDGVSFYYADYNNDAHKVDYDQKWPCCSGTFPQLTADYGISSYLRSPQGIAVNLYVPSRVSWRQGGARVSLTQRTTYPVADETAMELEMDRPERFRVQLRVPAWAGPKTAIRVNGKAAGVEVRPGTWAVVDREWRDGDRIELTLDIALRLVPIDPGHPDVVALVRGPVALFAIEPGSGGGTAPRMTRAQLMTAERASAGSADWVVRTDAGRVLMRPYPAITRERYRLYQQV